MPTGLLEDWNADVYPFQDHVQDGSFAGQGLSATLPELGKTVLANIQQLFVH